MHKRKASAGFTIIEVLIVLAIAGLIMMVLFLAVPALQRNARNAQRKRDVGMIASAYQEYANTGTRNILPGPGNNFIDCTQANMSVKCPFLKSANLSYYTVESVSFWYSNNWVGFQPLALGTDPDSLIISNYSFCGPSGEAAKKSTSSHKVVIAYALEAGNGEYSSQCLDVSV
jgi:prepilin-type N-terminal cleavage/methylation domain-containing protein